MFGGPLPLAALYSSLLRTEKVVLVTRLSISFQIAEFV